MKLFLTSAGLTNKSLVDAFNKLVGLPKEKIHISFIPTAANVEEGNKDWLIEDYNNLNKQGYGCVDIVDISAVTPKVWKPRLEASNILFFGGGNTFHLMHWIQKSRLDKQLPELLKTRVFAGISAGGCIAGPTIYNSVQNLFDEKYELVIKQGLNLVDFQFVPHLNSPYFKKIRIEFLEKAAKNVHEPVYVVDDNSAIQVVNNKVTAISEGVWKKIN
ncbi:MAG: Type 1 glutamine amidotransferase-like domain-containing protein [Patescibacteria group bacterium]